MRHKPSRNMAEAAATRAVGAEASTAAAVGLAGAGLVGDRVAVMAVDTVGRAAVRCMAAADMGAWAAKAEHRGARSMDARTVRLDGIRWGARAACPALKARTA